MNKLRKRLVVLFIMLDIGAIACLLLAYGPNKRFKTFIVTTAMSTMNHKYIAKTLYSENTINDVLNDNKLEELDEQTDLSAIKIGTYETKNFETKEEEEILKKKNNEYYKLITKKENNKTFYITVIYDPSRVSLGVSSTLGVVGKTVKEIAKENNATIAINASGFEDYGGEGNGARATGSIIKDGKLIWTGVPNKWGGGLIGFNKDNKLILTKTSPQEAIKNGMKDAVTFGPFLMVNGKEADVRGNGGTGVHPRTIIAQRQDGIVLFITIDGNGNKRGYRGGVDFKEMISLLKKYKAYNAANLDGGASSILVMNNKIVNNPVGYGKTGERRHPNAWIVK